MQRCLEWAVTAFRISASGVRDETQVHTHMCYSEFNDIIQSIADMDADVIRSIVGEPRLRFEDPELAGIEGHFDRYGRGCGGIAADG